MTNEQIQVRSTEFQPNAFLGKKHEFNAFGGNGQNGSPALTWTGVPSETKSLAVTLYDPDAPTGSGFWHWILFDLPPHTMELPPGLDAPPNGARHACNDYGIPGYGGPCPPEKDKPHRYIFTVHALNVPKLDVDSLTTNAVVRFLIHAHTIAEGRLMGLYQR